MSYKNIKQYTKYNKKETDRMINYISNLDKNTELYFWFDIAKSFHYLSIIIDSWEKEIFDIWEINNSIEWFEKIKYIIDNLENIWINKEYIYIWLEVTWSYYFSLINYFKKLNLKNIYVINGSKIKNFNLSINNSQTKNDKQDSIIIAKYINTYKNKLQKNDKIEDTHIAKNNYLEISNLKFLYRQLRKEKQERRRLMSKIKELTNRVFPEIYDVFKSAKSRPWELEYFIKSNYTKKEIISMKKEEFYNDVIKKSKIIDSFCKNKPKIFILHEILKNSIWICDDDWFYKFQMKILVDKYYQTDKNIKQIEIFILKELKKQNIYIPKIPWSSDISIGAFYCELWDSIFTKDHKQIAWFIWWYPRQNSSWWKTISKSRLEQRWNKLLREQVYLIAYNLCSKIEEVNQLKKKLMKQKNIKAIEALIIIWSIFIRIISTLYKTSQDFDLNLFKTNYLE